MYTVEHVISTMGGGRVLAAKLDIDESNCSQWLTNGYIPPKRAIQIVKLSDKLGLDVWLMEIPMEP